MDMHPVPQAMKTVSAPNSTIIVIIITISSFYCYHFDTEPSLLPHCSSAYDWVGVIWLYILHFPYIIIFLKFGSMCDYPVSKTDFSISAVFCRSSHIIANSFTILTMSKLRVAMSIAIFDFLHPNLQFLQGLEGFLYYSIFGFFILHSWRSHQSGSCCYLEGFS